MNKKEVRHKLILSLISEKKINTQQELQSELLKNGVVVTQATLSRDIKELGIVKIPLKDNTYIYELPKSIVRSLQLAENNIVHAERMGYMINLQVIPGNTIFVKSQLMTVFSDQIFSCIADDNSILMVLRSEETAKDIFEQVKNW